MSPSNAHVLLRGWTSLMERASFAATRALPADSEDDHDGAPDGDPQRGDVAPIPASPPA